MNFKRKLIIGLVIFLLVLITSFFIFRNKISDYLSYRAFIPKNGDFNNARIYLFFAGIFNSNRSDYQFTMGYYSWLEKRYDDALNYYSRAIDLGFSAMDRVLVDRGDIYQLKGDLNSAMADFKKAVEIKNNPVARYRMAEINFQWGKYDEVLSNLEYLLSLVKKDNQKVEIYNLMGRSYYAKQMYHEAINVYKKSLELNPNQPLINVWVARAFRNSRDIQEAINQLQAVLAKSPDYKPALCTLASSYRRARDYQNAIMMAEKGLSGEIEWDNVDCLLSLGNTYYDKKDFESAKSYLNNYLNSLNNLKLVGLEYDRVRKEAQDLLAKIASE